MTKTRPSNRYRATVIALAIVATSRCSNSSQPVDLRTGEEKIAVVGTSAGSSGSGRKTNLISVPIEFQDEKGEVLSEVPLSVFRATGFADGCAEDQELIVEGPTLSLVTAENCVATSIQVKSIYLRVKELSGAAKLISKRPRLIHSSVGVWIFASSTSKLVIKRTSQNGNDDSELPLNIERVGECRESPQRNWGPDICPDGPMMDGRPVNYCEAVSGLARLASVVMPEFCLETECLYIMPGVQFSTSEGGVKTVALAECILKSKN